jgi:hypothetical protein
MHGTSAQHDSTTGAIRFTCLWRARPPFIRNIAVSHTGRQLMRPNELQRPLFKQSKNCEANKPSNRDATRTPSNSYQKYSRRRWAKLQGWTPRSPRHPPLQWHQPPCEQHLGIIVGSPATTGREYCHQSQRPCHHQSQRLEQHKIQTIPKDRTITYARIVVDYWPQKPDPNRV